MNYYQPRQMNDGPNAGKWHYTCLNRRVGTWAVGYCAEGCDGHDTEDEARAHQRSHDLDHARHYKAEPWSPCQVCGHRTPNCIETAHSGTYWLCDEHNTREQLDALMPALAGDSISSW